MFTDEQEAALAAPLNGDFVKQRPGAGKQSLSYLEGWRAIEQANLVLGAGNWSREVVMMEPLHEPKLITDPEAPEKGKVVASYIARVRQAASRAALVEREHAIPIQKLGR